MFNHRLTRAAVIAVAIAATAAPTVVRIRGLLTSMGARINLFTVRVPDDVFLVIRCQGRSCPVHRFERRSPTGRLARLRRELLAGPRLVIKVFQSGAIGRWSTIVTRRAAPPRRSDQCAYPDARLPAPCPSG